RPVICARSAVLCAAGFFAFAPRLLLPGSATAGVPLIPPPAGARIVNFDDTDAPASFADAIALRRRYDNVGITFSAPGNDGGAVLNEGANFSVTGYSAPNFLAFNPAATLQGGGHAKFPETIEFRQSVSYVQLNIGDTSGLGITVEARDKNGT